RMVVFVDFALDLLDQGTKLADFALVLAVNWPGLLGLEALGQRADQGFPAIAGVRKRWPSRTGCVDGLEQPANGGRGHRINEAVLSVSAPIDPGARSPAGLTFDAVLEVHDDLKLTE